MAGYIQMSLSSDACPRKDLVGMVRGTGKVMECQCFLLTPLLAQRFGSISETPTWATRVTVKTPAEESVGAGPPESQRSGHSRHTQLTRAPGGHA